MQSNQNKYYYDGYAAHTNNCGYDDCQLAAGTPSRISWYQGWRDAEDDHRKKLSKSDFDNTNQQFESLAASQQPAWSGEGLPPVGIKCLTIGSHGDDSWYECTILAHTEFSGKTVAVFQYGDTISHSSAKWFKPLPLATEAERNRKEIAQQMCNLFGNGIEINEKEGFGIIWLDVYDAIEAGKIRGVKLEVSDE